MIKILSATSDTDIVDIDSIKTEVLKLRDGEKQRGEILVVGWGYDCYENEKVNIRITFEYPDDEPTHQDLENLLNEVIGTDNKYGNVVQFNSKFWYNRIEGMLEDFFKNMKLFRIEEEHYKHLNLGDLSNRYQGTLSLSPKYSRDGFENSPVKNFKLIETVYLDLRTKKLMMKTARTGYDAVEANVDHEKVYAYYVKTDNIAEIIDNAFNT